MPGSPDEPVSLDFFQNILAVGWGGPFCVLTHFDNATFDASESDTEGYFLDVQTPDGHQLIDFAGRRPEPLGSRPTWPADATEPKEAIFMDLGGLNRFVQSAPGEELIAGLMQVWLINPPLFWKRYGVELISEGAQGIPATMRVGINYGGGQSGYASPGGTMRLQLFPPSAMPYLLNFQQMITDNVSASGVPEPSPSNDLAHFMEWSDLTPFAGEALHTQFKDVIAGNAVAHGHHYDWKWNYVNRNNILDYPPDGAKPEITDP